MTPEELEKLQMMQRGLMIFIKALEEVKTHQSDLSVKWAVAERGRLISIALEDLCVILEGKKDE